MLGAGRAPEGSARPSAAAITRSKAVPSKTAADGPRGAVCVVCRGPGCSELLSEAIVSPSDSKELLNKALAWFTRCSLSSWAVFLPSLRKLAAGKTENVSEQGRRKGNKTLTEHVGKKTVPSPSRAAHRTARHRTALCFSASRCWSVHVSHFNVFSC